MTAGNVVPAALLFDLDGTLADSFEGIQYALNAALRDEGFPERELDWVRSHVGRGAPALVLDAVGVGAGEVNARRVGVRFADHYHASYLERTPVLPGAREALALAWARTGGMVAVISNKYERFSREWLRHVGLGEFVARVVGPDTFGVRKPDPGAVLPVLSGFGVTPADALFIGDMDVDVAAALAVGAPVVGVNPEARDRERLLAAGATAVMAALGELPAWLAENGRGWR
jgi:phosphoglycolate phosphatase